MMSKNLQNTNKRRIRPMGALMGSTLLSSKPKSSSTVDVESEGQGEEENGPQSSSSSFHNHHHQEQHQHQQQQQEEEESYHLDSATNHTHPSTHVHGNLPHRLPSKTSVIRPGMSSSWMASSQRPKVQSESQKTKRVVIVPTSFATTSTTLTNEQHHQQQQSQEESHRQHPSQPTLTTAMTTTTATTITPNNNTNTMAPPILVPYQYLGQLDPAWNIPPPKPNEKTLRDFCTKFKLPKEANSKNKDRLEDPHHDQGVEATKSLPPHPSSIMNLSNANNEQDVQRSGPLVEVINGEIVIQESSLIVGGTRKTTEEVDRELEGTIVVEESTGITATYNSFTKRQKTQHWSMHETKKFFRILRQCGTDFSAMETLFNQSKGNQDRLENGRDVAIQGEGQKSLGMDLENEGEDNIETGQEIKYRTRKQLKSKYLIECRKHPHLIDLAMNPSVQMNLDASGLGQTQARKSVTRPTRTPRTTSTSITLLPTTTSLQHTSNPSIVPPPLPPPRITDVQTSISSVHIDSVPSEPSRDQDPLEQVHEEIISEDNHGPLDDDVHKKQLEKQQPLALLPSSLTGSARMGIAKASTKNRKFRATVVGKRSTVTGAATRESHP